MLWLKADFAEIILEQVKIGTHNQAHGSKTEPTLILCGYSGERAIRKFADKQSSRQRTIKEFKHWGHSNPLWILGVAGQ